MAEQEEGEELAKILIMVSDKIDAAFAVEACMKMREADKRYFFSYLAGWFAGYNEKEAGR